MKCPVCAIELNMTERSGIEIDYCSQCRGVWLDRGELDKIIERSTPSPPPRGHEERPRQHQGYKKSDYHSKKKKRKSLLGELFDF
ncbi:MAG: zf-TFIIB domain-containing protein [Desulfobacteraceae bacterium]|nr:zf-TFIIB domain-containing protein [Desulfobacteraceae bacterium]